jgi:hypothetical protein
LEEVALFMRELMILDKVIMKSHIKQEMLDPELPVE